VRRSFGLEAGRHVRGLQHEKRRVRCLRTRERYRDEARHDSGCDGQLVFHDTALILRFLRAVVN